jgi:hypothetical protein
MHEQRRNAGVRRLLAALALGVSALVGWPGRATGAPVSPPVGEPGDCVTLVTADRVRIDADELGWVVLRCAARLRSPGGRPVRA